MKEDYDFLLEKLRELVGTFKSSVSRFYFNRILDNIEKGDYEIYKSQNPNATRIIENLGYVPFCIDDKRNPRYNSTCCINIPNGEDHVMLTVMDEEIVSSIYYPTLTTQTVMLTILKALSKAIDINFEDYYLDGKHTGKTDLEYMENLNQSKFSITKNGNYIEYLLYTDKGEETWRFDKESGDLICNFLNELRNGEPRNVTYFYALNEPDISENYSFKRFISSLVSAGVIAKI